MRRSRQQLHGLEHALRRLFEAVSVRPRHPLQPFERHAAAEAVALRHHPDGHRHRRRHRLGRHPRARPGRRRPLAQHGESALDGGQDLPHFERFDQVVDGAERLHLHRRVFVGEGRQEHERDLQRLAQNGGDIEAAHAFHPDVEQRQVGAVLARQQDRVVAVVGVDHFVTGLQQAVGQRGQHEPVIVHHQDLALVRHARSRFQSAGPSRPADGGHCGRNRRTGHRGPCPSSPVAALKGRPAG